LHGKSAEKISPVRLPGWRRADEDSMQPLHSRYAKRITGIAGLLCWCLLAWVGAGLAAEAAPLPAQQWNLTQLKRLKAPDQGPLTFAVLGDNRSNPAVFEQVLRHLNRDPDLAFAIDVGDLVERGTLEQFTAFFKLLWSTVRLPFLTAVGNHDRGKHQDLTLYGKIFGPVNYAFPFQDHYFIVFNDNPPDGMDEAHLAWLERELRQSQSYKTRLVFLHVPLYDPRGDKNHHCLPEAAGRRLTALFHKYGVSHIFAGHIHSYFTGRWDGVPYTITAGAGAPLYGTDPQHFFYHYVKVTLRGDQVETQVQRLSAPGSN
jgi:3',5'-cyclic AMP phosphodiesterase CpdA